LKKDLIGSRVRYIGKGNPMIDYGTIGTIVAYHKKLGNGKAYSAHVDVKPDIYEQAVFNTAYPFKTWEFISDIDLIGEDKIESAFEVIDRSIELVKGW
jgi:hypothetical protein